MNLVPALWLMPRLSHARNLEFRAFGELDDWDQDYQLQGNCYESGGFSWRAGSRIHNPWILLVYIADEQSVQMIATSRSKKGVAVVHVCVTE
jgi:hypothetical protein